MREGTEVLVIVEVDAEAREDGMAHVSLYAEGDPEYTFDFDRFDTERAAMRYSDAMVEFYRALGCKVRREIREDAPEEPSNA